MKETTLAALVLLLDCIALALIGFVGSIAFVVVIEQPADLVSLLSSLILFGALFLGVVFGLRCGVQDAKTYRDLRKSPESKEAHP